MITFKQFLGEARHRRDISIEFALEILKENCKDALAHADKPLWRGMSGTEDAYLVQPEAGERTSKNTSNHYTLIMDEFLPEQGYPMRSKSIICGNNKNLDYASVHGSLFALFPYDDTKIGVCHLNDIWHSPAFQMGKSTRRRRLAEWNDWFSEESIPDNSYEDLVDSLKEQVPKNHNVRLVFNDPEKIEDVLREGYSSENLKLNLADTKNIGEFEDRDREIWFSGKCVALQYATWQRLLKAGEFK